ncbi:MAG: hypothetical protein OYG31_02265 [Candidatus Kaiserbacteria bacterium]|nr:hypothetical protein [Candidatus Kaiserbacteria bacterium]
MGKIVAVIVIGVVVVLAYTALYDGTSVPEIPQYRDEELIIHEFDESDIQQRVAGEREQAVNEIVRMYKSGGPIEGSVYLADPETRKIVIVSAADVLNERGMSVVIGETPLLQPMAYTCTDLEEAGTCNGYDIEGFVNKPGYIERISVTGEFAGEGFIPERFLRNIDQATVEETTPVQRCHLYGGSRPAEYRDGAWVCEDLRRQGCEELGGVYETCSTPCTCRGRDGKKRVVEEGVACVAVVLQRCVSPGYYRSQ